MYEFSDAVVGANPPDPQGDGAAASQAPVAKTDSFQVEAGTVSLAFKMACGGMGSGRIRVVAPDGSLAYLSKTCEMVGPPGSCPCSGMLIGDPFSSKSAPPGTYTIEYQVAGDIDWTFTVQAKVPVASP